MPIITTTVADSDELRLVLPEIDQYRAGACVLG